MLNIMLHNYECRLKSGILAVDGKRAVRLYVMCRTRTVDLQHFKRIALCIFTDVTDLPIMLYNYPGRMGINMGEEFLDRVGRSCNF